MRFIKYGTICGLTAWAAYTLPSVQAANSIEGTWKIAHPQSAFTPTDGPIPFTDAGKQLWEANKADLAKLEFGFDHTQSRCSTPGVPRLALTPYPFRIWVRPRVVMFQYEWNHLSRTVNLTGKPFQSQFLAFDGQRIGMSEGHWEGKTLVVNVTKINPNTLIDDTIPHNDNMQIDERWHLAGPNKLEDDITITDADTFTRPWHTTVTYTRQPNEAFSEDVCLDRLKAGQMPLPLDAEKP